MIHFCIIFFLKITLRGVAGKAMTHHLSFEKLVEYDAGSPGISIDVELAIGELNISVNAKVDTGSERCVFSKQVGESLGIDVESGERPVFRTATGLFIAYGFNVTLTTVDYSFDSSVYFAVDEFFNNNVLGRFGWLNRMIVGINDYDGKLYLRRYDL